MSPQGKKRKPPAPAPKRGPGHRLVALIVFAVFVVGAFIWVAAAQGIGEPSLADDAVATVEDAPDGTVTTEELDFWIEVAAFRQQLEEPPAEDDPQYAQLRDAAMGDAILSRWVAGEASERGIEVSERELGEAIDQEVEANFGGNQKQFDKFLEDSPYDQETASEQIELRLMSDRIQQDVLPTETEPDVSDDQIEAYYDENIAQFEQPETRDVRVILTKDEAKADDALAALEQDDSPKSFERVAKEFSTDEATKNSGGLREAVAEGQSEPALDEQIFSAPEGELVGPFESEAGFYVIKVEAITPAQTTPIDEARDQISQTIAAADQQALAQNFQEDFQAKWTARTFCAPEFAIEQCSNAPQPPDPCTEELAETQGCDAPVASRPSFAPGTETVAGGVAPTLLPQGPITPQSAVPEGGVPPGLESLPGGAVPPGGAPQGAPPGSVPPGSVPPG